MSGETLSPNARARTIDNVTENTLRVNDMIGDHVSYTMMSPIPHESGVDFSETHKPRTRRAGVATAAALSGIMAVGAIGAVSAQENPSPKPSSSPDAGLNLDPLCLSPVPSLAPESPLPSMSPNPNASIDVFVTDSPAPFSPLSEVQTEDELALDDEALTENSTETDETLTPEESLAPEFTPDPCATDNSTDAVVEVTPEYDLSLSGKGQLLAIIENNQQRGDFEKTSLKNIKKQINSLWRNHGEELSRLTGTYDDPVTKKYFSAYLVIMEKGFKPNSLKEKLFKNKKKLIGQFRTGFSSGLMFDVMVVYNKTDNPEAKLALAELGDSARNYGVLTVDPNNWKKSKKRFDGEIESSLISLSEYIRQPF